jgi:hypothetical protein
VADAARLRKDLAAVQLGFAQLGLAGIGLLRMSDRRGRSE